MKERTALILEDYYRRYHRPEFIDPDPLIFPRRFSDKRDVEVAAFIAASFALGRVNSIISFLERFFNALGSPYAGLTGRSEQEIRSVCRDFKYRFYCSDDISHFLLGIRRVLLEFGSIERCFMQGFEAAGTGGFPEVPVLAGLSAVADAVNREGSKRNLVSNPGAGSACKRLFLFLRWVVRKDCIDPGFWEIPESELIIPLDTHVMKVSRYLGLTDRNSADFKTAFQITGNLKLFDKEDPVKYDFSMSRIGIHPGLSYAELENDIQL